MKGLGQLQDHQVLTTLLVTEGEPRVSAALILIVMTVNPPHESSERKPLRIYTYSFAAWVPSSLALGIKLYLTQNGHLNNDENSSTAAANTRTSFHMS